MKWKSPVVKEVAIRRDDHSFFSPTAGEQFFIIAPLQVDLVRGHRVPSKIAKNLG